MTSGTITAAKFCRHCGYNLHGLPENRCPECGRTFDPNNPVTFFRHSGSLSRRRWAKRIFIAVASFLLLAGAAGFSLWYPWHREQAAVRMVQRYLGYVLTETVGPQWLQSLLGQQAGFLLQRVYYVNLGSYKFPDTDTIPDTDLPVLRGLPGLVYLNLDGTQVTDVGLEHLKELKRLQSLSLDRTRVTDAELVHLKELKGLQSLSLAGTPVTDAGLEHLKDLEGLHYLCLDHTNVTDAGLEHLKELKELHGLYLWHTKVTDAGVAKLQKALPDCHVER